MEPKGSLLCSQEPVTGPYLQQDESSPHPYIVFPTSILILSSHLHPYLSSGLFPSVFLTKIVYAFLISPIHATCPTHAILLDLIAVIIFGEAPHYAVFSGLLPLPPP